MFQFVKWLKLLAVIMITNSHYTDIWPISALAFGGHIGNCLYFFLSGFCLYHIKESFPKWYIKRLIRIYPSYWIAAVALFLLADFSANTLSGLFHCLVYPTWFHFIGTIVLFYAIYYALRYIQKNFTWVKTPWLMLAVLAVFLIFYALFFDKTYYHIDSVEEKWVWFQFGEAMLLGGLLRERYDNISSKIHPIHVVSVLLSAILYFISKKAFSSVKAISALQFTHPVLLLSFIYSLTVLFLKMERKGLFLKIPDVLNRTVGFLSGLTLEVYLVQYPVIARLSGLLFPVNCVVVTGLIILLAWMLNRCSRFVQNRCKSLLRLTH